MLDDQNKGQNAFEQPIVQGWRKPGFHDDVQPRFETYFFGFAIFQWQDAFWKCADEYKKYSEGNACTESTFGIQTVGDKTMTGTITNRNCGLLGSTYPVNALNPKPIYG